MYQPVDLLDLCDCDEKRTDYGVELSNQFLHMLRDPS